MTEGMVEVDMRAGVGLCWSDVAADIKAGNPVEASAAESDSLEHYRQRWVVGIGEASLEHAHAAAMSRGQASEPLGVTPAGDPVFLADLAGWS
jgi:uncharacterized protein (UPF0548 family)